MLLTDRANRFFTIGRLMLIDCSPNCVLRICQAEVNNWSVVNLVAYPHWFVAVHELLYYASQSVKIGQISWTWSLVLVPELIFYYFKLYNTLSELAESQLTWHFESCGSMLRYYGLFVGFLCFLINTCWILLLMALE